MKSLKFEWDQSKASSNITKHGVSFEEAKTVFDDDFARMIPDPTIRNKKNGLSCLGMSYTLKILAVVHCYRDQEGIIRIISARRSTKNEERQYKELLP